MGISKAQAIYPLVDNTTKETSESVLAQNHPSIIFKHFWKGTNHFSYFILLAKILPNTKQLARWPAHLRG
jgi:hypothetical protein